MLAQRLTLAEAIGPIALLGYGVAIVITLLLPETNGMDLKPGAEAPPASAPPRSPAV